MIPSKVGNVLYSGKQRIAKRCINYRENFESILKEQLLVMTTFQNIVLTAVLAKVTFRIQ